MSQIIYEGLDSLKRIRNQHNQPFPARSIFLKKWSSSTLIFHSHYIVVDSMQLTIFLKNFAIIGGLLVIISNKPKICSIDYYLESKKGKL